jgi:hypothetical protein
VPEINVPPWSPVWMPPSDDGKRVNMLFGALIYLDPKFGSIPPLGLTKKPPMICNPRSPYPETNLRPINQIAE